MFLDFLTYICALGFTLKVFTLRVFLIKIFLFSAVVLIRVLPREVPLPETRLPVWKKQRNLIFFQILSCPSIADGPQQVSWWQVPDER